MYESEDLLTRIEHAVFSVDLPGEWHEVDRPPESLTYREEAGAAVFVAIVLRVRPVYAIADRARLLDDYIQHRSNYERGQAPALVNSEASSTEADGAFEAHWSAHDLASGVRRRHRVVLRRDILIDFAYESPAVDEAHFEREASEVLSAAAVPIPDPD